MNLDKLNKKLQTEAFELLESAQLRERLEKIGMVELGGSFVYGTMVDEDIDVAVIVDKENLNYQTRKRVMNDLLDIEGLDGIAMTDRHHNPKNGAPNGLWFGPIINFKGRKWNIDIWLITKDEPYSHHNNTLNTRMKNISEDQRTTILKIKYDALLSGQKEKGVTSSEIYIAVLDNRVLSFPEFIANKKDFTK
jgi:hypothetical protein